MSLSKISYAQLIVEDGRTIRIEYTISSENEIMETTKGGKPVQFVFGQKKIISGLSKALIGMRAGEEKTITLKPKDAYGQVDENAFREIAKSSLPNDFVAKDGIVIKFKDPEDREIRATVWEDLGKEILLNFNHPLAGKTVTCYVKVVSIK